MKQDLPIAAKLSLVVALLSIIASMGGLLMDGLYRDSEAIKAVWFVNDLITVLVAVPILLLSIRLALKGSLRASLVWVGSLWYLLYNYVFYLYGAVFNALFLVYVLLFVLSACSLVLALVHMDIPVLKSRLLEKAPCKPVSFFLFVFAAALGTPWVLLALRFILSGETTFAWAPGMCSHPCMLFCGCCACIFTGCS